MCLESRTRVPYVAQEDKVCYKMVYSYDRKIYSWIREEYICKEENIIGFKQKPSLISRIFSRIHESNLFNIYTISSGWIHSYKFEIDMLFYTAPTIYKCIIPKGTEYFMSYDGGGEYASKCIIYKERIQFGKYSELLNL